LNESFEQNIIATFNINSEEIKITKHDTFKYSFYLQRFSGIK